MNAAPPAPDVADRAELPPPAGTMALEWPQLVFPYEHLRVRDERAERRLAATITHEGQRSAALVVRSAETGYALIDGYRRARVLRRMGRDTLVALAVDLEEAEALAYCHRLETTRRRSAVEDGWLVRELLDATQATKPAAPPRRDDEAGQLARDLGAAAALVWRAKKTLERALIRLVQLPRAQGDGGRAPEPPATPLPYDPDRRPVAARTCPHGVKNPSAASMRPTHVRLPSVRAARDVRERPLLAVLEAAARACEVALLADTPSTQPSTPPTSTTAARRPSSLRTCCSDASSSSAPYSPPTSPSSPSSPPTTPPTTSTSSFQRYSDDAGELPRTPPTSTRDRRVDHDRDADDRGGSTVRERGRVHGGER